ncbi:MAG: hypothetical protein ABJC79_07745, partial [Acidimicrobiia bacterium]
LGRIAAARGQFAAALEIFDRAAAELVAIGADSDAIEVEIRKAECLLLSGAPEAAMHAASAALKRDLTLGSVVDHGPLLRIRAEALLAAGDDEGARQAITGSLDDARARETTFEIARSLVVLAEIEHRAGDDVDATDHRTAAEEIFDRLGVVVTPFGPRR